MAKKQDSSKPKIARTDEIILAGKPLARQDRDEVPLLIAKALGAFNSQGVSISSEIEAHLSWAQEEEHINSRELADYLLSFTRMYSAASQLREDEIMVESVALIERAFPRPKPMDSFRILRISYASPLECVIGGIAIGIALAVVFSGGQFEITTKGLKAKLPPIGTGIAAIGRALAMLPRRKHYYDDSAFYEVTSRKSIPKAKGEKKALPAKPHALKDRERSGKARKNPKS